MPDPVPSHSADTFPNAEIDALVVRHRAELDRIHLLDSAGQQAVLRSLGVDPAAIKEHYKDLITESEELRRRDAVASKGTQAMGWTSAAVATGGSLAAGRRLGSWVVRAFTIPVIALSAGFAGVFAGSRIFSGNIRDKSKELNIEARNALDRELAVAIENKVRSAAPAAPAAAAVEVAEAGTPANAATASITPRDPSFAAQAAGDKTAAATAETRRA